MSGGMRRYGSATAAGLVAVLGGCVPNSGGYQPPPGPAGASPVATTSEIIRYVSDGSAFIEYLEGSPYGGYECGYFAPNGSYESFWADYDEIIYDDFYGSWSVRGSQLCFHGYWDSGDVHFGCNLAEWSLDDTLLLINSRDQVVAEIFTYDGPGEYDYGCGF